MLFKQAVPRAAKLMKPGCLWIGVSRLNSLMSNEVQALIKVFPTVGEFTTMRSAGILPGSSGGRAHAAALLPQTLSPGCSCPRYLWARFG